MKKRLQKEFYFLEIPFKPNVNKGILYSCFLIFTLLSFTGSYAQKVVRGHVSSDGTSLPGVNVSVKGTSLGTSTDASGNYSISLSGSQNTLVFSYIGFLSQETVVGDRSTINIQLEEDQQALDEVVVVGYGTLRKKDLTGALSSISTSEFEEQPVTRIDQVLQGRATGVQVTNSSGAPGGEARIRIRGANSVLGNNDPLFVIDGFVGADFNTINTNDIESIQVLKDAASTAIYGSRGANGVVIVTTKTGKSGFQVTYSGQGSTSDVIKKWDVLNGPDFAEIANERSVVLGVNPIFSAEQISELRASGGTNWQDLVFRRAAGQQHQLGVSGGGEKTSYLISANYINEKGIINNSGYKRYVFRSNINSKLNDNFTVRFNVTGSRTENHNTNIIGGTGNPVVQALSWSPTLPAYDAAGNITPADAIGSVGFNPVALMYERANDTQGNFVNLLGGVNYKLPVEGLTLDLQYGVNYNDRLTQTFNGNLVTRNNPNASRGSTENITLQSTNALNYRRVFNEDHNLDVVAVIESQQFRSNSFGANATGLKFPSLEYYNLQLANTYGVNTGYTKWTLLSYLARANYAYKNKYLVSASVRRDGSSKFAEGNKWSVFPSVGLGYNLSEEQFIQDMGVFSNLKIRGSWGKTGSQAINPYATLSTYNTNAPMAFDNASTASGIQLGNPGNLRLRWETTEQKDIGIEAGFFQDRLSIEADYFVKNTTDLLLNRSLPEYVGGGSQTLNVGEVENKGIEVSLKGVILNSDNVNWTSNFNFSTVKNRVTSLGGIAPRIGQGTGVGAGMSITNEFMLMPEYSLGSYWGVKYLGTWKPGEEAEASKYNAKPGDSRYEDINKDDKISTDDFQIIGKGMPTTTAGWNNTISYKDLTLNVFFQGVFGVDKLNYTRAAAMSGSGDARQYILTEIKDRYIPGVNETSDIPAFSSSNVVFTQSSRFVENGNYIRLKNVSLSYRLPESTVKKVGIQLFVSGTNLLTISNYKGIDPESTNISSGTDTAIGIDYGGYPNSRTITGGINLTF